jgi:hypothetical protein
MKTIVSIATLVWLSCAVLLAQTNNSAATPQAGKKEGVRCDTANPAIGYARAKLAESKREIKLYNVDFDETDRKNKAHDPICLSRGNGDTILWASGEGKKFKMRIHLEQGQDPQCGQHPFIKEPPNDTVDGYFSGSLRPDVPFYCLYEVEFQKEDGKISDPHIQTTPP